MRHTKALISTLLLAGLGLTLSACVVAPYPGYAYDSGYSGAPSYSSPSYYPYSSPSYYPYSSPSYYSGAGYYSPTYYSGYSAPGYYYGPSVGVYYAGGGRGGWDRDRWRH